MVNFVTVKLDFPRLYPNLFPPKISYLVISVVRHFYGTVSSCYFFCYVFSRADGDDGVQVLRV